MIGFLDSGWLSRERHNSTGGETFLSSACLRRIYPCGLRGGERKQTATMTRTGDPRII